MALTCGGVAAIPPIAGRTASYTMRQLWDIKQGTRVSPLMAPVVANLTSEDMMHIVAYLASQSPSDESFPVDWNTPAGGLWPPADLGESSGLALVCSAPPFAQSVISTFALDVSCFRAAGLIACGRLPQIAMDDAATS